MTQGAFPPSFATDALPFALARSASLTRIMAAGRLSVGVSAGIKGMSMWTAGTCQGVDADFACGLSAVIFADQREVAFQVVNPPERFTALAEGRIDIGLYNASKTMTRELDHDVVFPVVTLIDGEGLLTTVQNRAVTLRDWQGPTIGVQAGTTSASNILRHRGDRPCAIRAFDTLADAISALRDGQIDAVAFDTIALAGVLSDMPDRDCFAILPERISRELMGPVVPLSDPVFARLVSWVFAALVHASDLGLRQDLSTATDALTPDQAAFLATGLALWSDDPLAQTRMRCLIAACGTSDEIFARNLGAQSDLGLMPGLNASTLRGGILHPPPL